MVLNATTLVGPPFGFVGTRVGLVGTCVGSVGTSVESARLFGYQYIGIDSTK